MQALCLAGFPLLDEMPLQTFETQRAEQGLGCSSSQGPAVLCVLSPVPSCTPGTEQCLFRLWEKTLCKQQSVNVVTSPLQIASLYLFSYPLCFHHLLPPTLIAAMPELLFLPGCCRQKLRQACAEAAQECLCCRAPGEGPACCSCPKLGTSTGKGEICELSSGWLRRRKAWEGGCETPSPAGAPCDTGDTTICVPGSGRRFLPVSASSARAGFLLGTELSLFFALMTTERQSELGKGVAA